MKHETRTRWGGTDRSGKDDKREPDLPVNAGDLVSVEIWSIPVNLPTNLCDPEKEEDTQKKDAKGSTGTGSAQMFMMMIKEEEEVRWLWARVLLGTRIGSDRGQERRTMDLTNNNNNIFCWSSYFWSTQKFFHLEDILVFYERQDHGGTPGPHTATTTIHKSIEHI